MNKLNICIAGLGNVGTSLIKSIENNSDFILNKTSIEIKIIAISAKSKSKKRNIDINNYEWFDNPLDMALLDDCDVIVELIGQEKGISYDLIELALKNKKHVVTANKALIANHGNELFELAENNSNLQYVCDFYLNIADYLLAKPEGIIPIEVPDRELFNLL